jgi:large subunit ribosomal protein L27
MSRKRSKVNGRDSNPKYLGVKLFDGQEAKAGNIILRQRGERIKAGKNVGVGGDYTLFALKNGVIKFEKKRDCTKVHVLTEEKDA